jgi:hypothetical protein
LIPESERIQTLTDLKNNREQINQILAKMPISMRTEHLKSQKKEMEQKILEIDRAIELFSKKEVYVRMD